MRGPGLTGLRLHLGEAGARRWIGNVDEMIASGALDLPARVARIALQRLLTMGTMEFEFGGIHEFHPPNAQIGHK
jgi:hypothetical protein